MQLDYSPGCMYGHCTSLSSKIDISLRFRTIELVAYGCPSAFELLFALITDL
jgi:hypothetical protein